MCMEVCLCCEWSIIHVRYATLEMLSCIIIILSGLSAAVTIFDEEEIVAGDLVKVELDLDVFKMMHEAAGLWFDEMTAVIISLYVCMWYMIWIHRLMITDMRGINVHKIVKCLFFLFRYSIRLCMCYQY